ncbi:MAG: CBS domain-containing protein, partial [Gemmatimonadota bacterium]
MTDDLVTVTPSYTLREAAEAMAQEHVSGLPVVDDGMAVGVISATDLLGFAAEATGERAASGGGRPGPSRGGAE